MSNLTDSAENAARGDMSYALKQFFQEGGAAYVSPIAFEGALPMNMGAVMAATMALIEDDAELEKAKHDALSKVPVSVIGSQAAVLEIRRKIEAATTVGGVAQLVAVLVDVVNSTERLKGEEIDPEVERIESMNAMDHYLYKNDPVYRATIDKLNEESKKNFAEFDKKTAEFEGIVKQNGLKSSQDQAIADLTAQIEKEREAKNFQRAFELEAQLVKAQEARIAELTKSRPDLFPPAVAAPAAKAAGDIVAQAASTEVAAKQAYDNAYNKYKRDVEQDRSSTIVAQAERVAPTAKAAQAAAREETFDFGGDDAAVAKLGATMVDVPAEQTAQLAKPTDYRDPTRSAGNGAGLSA